MRDRSTDLKERVEDQSNTHMPTSDNALLQPPLYEGEG